MIKLLPLLLIVSLWAENSGTYDFRAHQSYKKGELLKAERLWTTSFQAAQKEGHNKHKNLALGNLAELYC